MDDRTLEVLRNVLTGVQDLRLAIAFGSVASGRAAIDSDLDLAVGKSRPLSAADRMALIATLANALGRPVDLVDLAAVGEPLLGEILAGGRRVIGGDEEYAALLHRHLCDQADFLPYRNRILAERRNAWIGK